MKRDKNLNMKSYKILRPPYLTFEAPRHLRHQNEASTMHLQFEALEALGATRCTAAGILLILIFDEYHPSSTWHLSGALNAVVWDT